MTRWLDRLSLNRLRAITPDREDLRAPGKITARFPGHMLHLDVKKIGKVRDWGGWWAHRRGSTQDRARHRDRVGYTFLHTAIDGFSGLAYTEAVADERAATTIAFSARARAFFAAHGITGIVRVITDNGMKCRASAFRRTVLAHALRHHRTRPYTPRHNWKVERY